MDTIILLKVFLIGVGATLIMDVWSWIQTRILGIPSLNYALVARWMILIPRGQLFHRPIMATPQIKGETWLGWALHYFIGVVFALMHVMLWGEEWIANANLAPALFTGVLTLVFPFYVIQPCLGFGIAASKTPSPWRARCLSLLAHGFYGFGLSCTAALLQ